jgi:hypothetical protein
MSSELHLNHYDDEDTMTIDAYDTEALAILHQLSATHLRDNLYRLPVEQAVQFLTRRFHLDVRTTHRQPVSEAQREARRNSLAQARARRWAKATQ